MRQAQKLANMTGLRYYAFGKFRDFENGGYGVAILSRFPIESSIVFRYTKPHTRISNVDSQLQTAICAIPEEGDYCQGALSVLVNIGREKLWFATTHLGSLKRSL